MAPKTSESPRPRPAQVREVLLLMGPFVSGLIVAVASHLITSVVAPAALRDGQYAFQVIMFYFLGTIAGALASFRVASPPPDRSHAWATIGVVGSWVVGPILLYAVHRSLA